jgi:hypothetical protein
MQSGYPEKELPMRTPTVVGKLVEPCHHGEGFEVQRTMYAPGGADRRA